MERDSIGAVRGPVLVLLSAAENVLVNGEWAGVGCCRDKTAIPLAMVRDRVTPHRVAGRTGANAAEIVVGHRTCTHYPADAHITLVARKRLVVVSEHAREDHSGNSYQSVPSPHH